MSRTIPFALAAALALPAFALTGAMPAAAGALEPEAPYEHSMSDPIELTLTLLTPAERATDLTLQVVARPTMSGITDAVVSISADPTLKVVGASSVSVSFPLGAPAQAVFTLRAGDAGTHHLDVRASAEHALGTLGGWREANIVLPETGVGEFYEGVVPPNGRLGFATQLDVAPLAELLPPPDLRETPGPDLSFERPPLPEGWVEGETGDVITPASHSTFVVRACWLYVTETGGSLAQRFATVEVWDDDGVADDLLWSGITGSDGCFTSGTITRAEECCFSGNQDIYVNFYTTNTWTRVQTTGGTVYGWSSTVATVGTEDTFDRGAWWPGTVSPFAARQFQYINNGGDFARNNAAVAGLGQVKVNMPDTFCSGMCYTRSDDTIHIPSTRDNSPDDANHEYGHYVQDKMYGDSFWPSPGGAHSLCGDGQNIGLSWTEGYGDFFGPRVNNEVSANGANGDVLYSRPWDGSSFSINMETNDCGVSGFDNEMNVAQALWDLRDSVNDGFDTSSDTNALIHNVIEACDDSSYSDYYGGTCSWTSNGGSRCNFLRTAFQNDIDLNNNPTQSLTTQTGGGWTRGVITIAGTASDADGGCPTLSVNFRVSGNNLCSTADADAGTDTTSPYSVTFNTATVADGSGYFTCALANDGIEDAASWSISSASFGIDNALPSLSNGFTGTAGGGGWWRSSVTVSVTCTDATSGVASRQYSLNGGSFVTYSSAVTISAQGTTTFQSRCTDNAGNIATSPISSVSIDTNAPTTSASVSGTLGSNGWHTSPVTVTLTCSDPVPGSGCSSNQYNLNGAGFVTGSSVSISGQGTHTLQYRSVDVAGNTGSGGSLTPKIDSVAPTTSVSLSGTSGSGGYYRSSVSATLSCTDSTSGVWTREYSLDGGAFTAYSSAVTISTQGAHSFVGRCRDNAGLMTTETRSFSIDSVVPTSAATKSGTLGLNGWYTTPVGLSITCSDPSPGSGCTPQYDLDGTGFVSGSSASVSTDGSHTFSHRATDGAGNVGSATSDPFKIDQTAPTLGVTLGGTAGNAGWYTSAVTVTLTCADATSGVGSRTYTVDGGASQTYTSPFTVSAQGAHTVAATCRDNAGLADSETRTFSIDSAGPSTSAALAGTLGDNGWYRTPVSVTLTCSDPSPGSSCATTEYDLDGAGFVAGTSLSEAGEGSHTLSYRSTDVAGTTGSTGSSPFKIDTADPSLAVSVSGTTGNGGWYTSSVTVAVTCSDATSGVASRAYTVNGGPSTPYSAPFTVATQGTNTVVVTCRDNAGNSASATETIMIDSQAPTVTLIADLPIGIGTASLSWSASDATSGLTGDLVIEYHNPLIAPTFVEGCRIPVSGASQSGSCSPTTGPGQWCFRATVQDVAGNTVTTLASTCVIVV